MRRILIVLGIIVLAAGCAGNKPKAEQPQGDSKLSDPPQGGDEQVAMPQGPPVVRPGSEEGEADDSADTSESGEPTSDGSTASVTRAKLDEFLDKGTPYVLTVVTVEPSHTDGFQGFQIVDVTRGAREFMMPQIQVGDVVTHVNGIKIQRPDDLTQAWRSLNKVSSIRIDFKRQGEPMTAVWDVR